MIASVCVCVCVVYIACVNVWRSDVYVVGVCRDRVSDLISDGVLVSILTCAVLGQHFFIENNAAK